MKDVQKIIDLYFVTNKLKNVLRQGWINWQVEDIRVESIAEHIYGTLMLAVSICANTNQDIDLYKVALMLALHEVEEIIIGDIAFFDIEKQKTKKDDKDKENTLQLRNFLGTLPSSILLTNSSTIAVFPTPASPIKTGLFFVLRNNISINLLTSSSLPITGS